MLRLLWRLTRIDRVRNGDIRETVQVQRFEDMRQFGHVQKQWTKDIEDGAVGHGKRERPQRKFMTDVTKEDGGR